MLVFQRVLKMYTKERIRSENCPDKPVITPEELIVGNNK